MRFARALSIFLALTTLGALLAPPANAAPSLNDVQRQIVRLQEQAAASAEGAQAAKVQLDQLARTLKGIREQVAVQSASVAGLRKSLGAIAISQYQSGGMGQGLELLFSANPALYLSAAGSLDAVTRRKSLQLRQYAAARQRLSATTLTVNDKLSLVRATRARLVAQTAQANAKLAQVESLLGRLKQADRIRLAALNAQANARDQRNSRTLARSIGGVSGRGGIAIRFALAQLGDSYVFGAAGMVYWDCSGLTMRAFQAAGVSLPHSAAAQANYGRYVPLNQIRPGDLVFFGSPITHTGIYLGGGKMVDAPHTGARVRIEPFGSWFGWERFVAARRF